MSKDLTFHPIIPILDWRFPYGQQRSSFFAILFLAFLALSAALIVWMFISLVRLGMSGGS